MSNAGPCSTGGPRLPTIPTARTAHARADGRGPRARERHRPRPRHGRRRLGGRLASLRLRRRRRQRGRGPQRRPRLVAQWRAAARPLARVPPVAIGRRPSQTGGRDAQAADPPGLRTRLERRGRRAAGHRRGSGRLGRGRLEPPDPGRSRVRRWPRQPRPRPARAGSGAAPADRRARWARLSASEPGPPAARRRAALAQPALGLAGDRCRRHARSRHGRRMAGLVRRRRPALVEWAYRRDQPQRLALRRPATGADASRRRCPMPHRPPAKSH